MLNNKKENFIIIVSAVPFPYGNASDNIIYTFMDGFQEHGCQGEVLCLYRNLPPQYSNLPSSGDYLGVKYRYLSGKTQRSKYKLRRLWDFKYLPQINLRKYIIEKQKTYNISAIFITHIGQKFFSLSRICHKLNVPVVQTTCEYPMLISKEYDKNLPLFRKYSQFVDKYIFETRTLQEFESNAVGKQLNSIIIPSTLPFDDILKTKKDSRSSKYIAYSGSIHSESKDGLKNIVRAFSMFHKTYTDFSLMFIGRIANEGYYTELLDLIDSLGIKDDVKFTGEVTRDEYVHHLINAQLMIVAKPKDSYYVGGLSSKVIEYLFSGNPVIMTKADDYVHYLTHNENVYFVEDNEPETLCKALNVLFGDDELKEKIAKGGRNYAMKHFNYHILTEELLKFILK